MRASVIIRSVLCCAALLAPQAAARITITASRIDAAAGGPLVVPVEVSARRDTRRPVRLLLQDGRRLDAQLWWIGVEPNQPAPQGPTWTPEPHAWIALPAKQAWKTKDRPAGGWFVLADLPADADGLNISLNTAPAPINWITPPPGRTSPVEPAAPTAHDLEPVEVIEPIGPAAAPDESAGREPVMLLFPFDPLPPEVLASPEVQAAIERLRGDPTTRWRAALLTGEMRGAHTDVALERVARAHTLRWSAVFARLQRIDPVLGEQLATHLSRTVRAGNSWVPAWLDNPVIETQILDSLLDPDRTDEQAARRARAWLVDLPDAIAWVIDDAGRTTDAGPAATIGVVNIALGASTTLVRTDEGIPAELGPMPIEPRTIAQATLAFKFGGEPGPALRSARVPVRVGSWRGTLEVVTNTLAARPPGVRLGPLLSDWTMRGWMGHSPGGDFHPPDDHATAALLHRTDIAGDSPNASGSEVIVECAIPQGSSLAGDAVTLWIGPFGAPGAVITVRPDGIATLADGTPIEASAVVEDGRWIARVRLPGDMSDDILRVGLTRTDASGRRTAWPRRMLPWQDEPGRIAIDLSAWDGLGE